MDTNNVKASTDSVSTGLSNFMCIIYIFKANSSILFQPYLKTSNIDSGKQIKKEDLFVFQIKSNKQTDGFTIF